MRIHCFCPDPACRAPIDVGLHGCGQGHARCAACGEECVVQAEESAGNGVLTRCLCCAGEELYVRKDFPQRTGLIMVVLVAGFSFYLFGRGELIWALGVLVGLVVIDLIIYRLVPTITVCYRCKAEFRDVPINPQHAGFDLATSEKYR